MKKVIYPILLSFYAIILSCQQDAPELNKNQVPNDIISKLQAAGFDTSEGLSKYKNGYLVEYDIFLTEEKIDELADLKPDPKNGRVKHYRTYNLVTGTPRTIGVYMDPGFGSYMQDAFDAALDRYNSRNLGLTFQRVSGGADISIFAFYEESNVLGYSAGFPSGGDPASPIYLNTYYYNDASQRADATTVIAHEIGHAIGFRHTDYMNRAFSCGVGGNEGEAGVGAVQIPGTPSGPSAGSWMLACSSNTDRPFTAEDQVALAAVYPAGGFSTDLNVYAIKKYGTGTQSTEVHVLNGQDGYSSFIINTGTILQETDNTFDFLVNDFNQDGSQDVVAIKKSQTGSASTEIHILNGQNNFQSFLVQTGTALHETDNTFDFGIGDYNHDGYKDIFVIKKSATGTSSTEVHVLNGSDNYQSYILNTGTALGESGDNFDFLLDDYNGDGYTDLIGVLKSQTGSGTTEVHVLDGSNNFQSFLLQTGTALGEVDNTFEFDAGDINGDGALDIYAFKKSGTPGQKTEIHVLNGQGHYQSFLLQTETALSETGNDFKLLVGN